MDPDMWKSLSLNTRPGKTKSSGLRHYFEVNPHSNELRHEVLISRRELQEVPQTVGYIKCTHFVANSMKRDCKGFMLAYRVDGVNDSWCLGWVHSLTYDIRSPHSTVDVDGTLRVFRWIGTTAVSDDN